MKPRLSIDHLKLEAAIFTNAQSGQPLKALYGATDGKAVGTYFEARFREHLQAKYGFTAGNAASGIDFPELFVDLKVTSRIQPQSSCPFKSARQKVYGLGYSILLFVYAKEDDHASKAATFVFENVLLIDASLTADYQLTRAILGILENDGNEDDLVACFMDKNLPVDEIGATALAVEVLATRPALGYLTVSNALQWRLQYGHAIKHAGTVPGLTRL